jgi:hypothetical protein
MITSQRVQYGGTVHLFIGTGRIPDKITFVFLITNHNHSTNYKGLCGCWGRASVRRRSHTKKQLRPKSFLRDGRRSLFMELRRFKPT